MTSSRGSSGARKTADVRTITVSNSKGGSTKTTLTVCLAAAFAERGQRVLVIDLDPQGSATEWLGGQESPIGLVEFSGGSIPIRELVKATTASDVDLIPASRSLLPAGRQSGADVGLAIASGLARLPGRWDVVLVDTPSTLHHLALAPLVRSDHLLVPVEAHGLALTGVASVIAGMERARRRVNRRLTLLGIVATRVNSTTHARQVLTRLRSSFGAAVLESVVRESIRVAEAPAVQRPITAYASGSSAARDFRAVADELLERLGDHGGGAG